MTELEKAARMALDTVVVLSHQSRGHDRLVSETLDALTQALATTEPGFDGSVIVGHSKHRGGWFVFEEVSEGEFTPIKGPFSSRDEADQAMRDPHAPLIQPATTEPDVPETNFGNTTERKVEPVAALIRHRRIRTEARIAHDGKDHYSEWSEWQPATLSHARAVANPSNFHGLPPLWEMMPLYTSPQVPEDTDEATIPDYQEALRSVDALVRKLDIALNGKAAAPQARLCDIVSQVESEGFALVPVEPTPEMIYEVEHAARLGAVWTAESVYKAMLAARPLPNPQKDQALRPVTEDDPCKGCRKGIVCRTPECGRLKLPIDHPYRASSTACAAIDAARKGE